MVFRRFLFLIIIFAIVFVFSCNKNSSTEPEENLKVTITDIEGSWGGITNKDGIVSFDVTERIITRFKISYFMGTYWQSTEEWGNWSLSSDHQSFTVSLHAGGGFLPDLFVSGVFKSNIYAEGTYMYQTLDGTWSANKR